MDVTERVCDLECLNQGKIHEFEGPVKILLMDHPAKDVYKKKKSGAALVAIANMMIGATVMIVLFLTMDFDYRPLFRPLYVSIHIILCTIGYQLCLPSGILMLHALNGAAAPLKKRDRRYQHIIIQVFGMACSLVGSYLIYNFQEPWNVFDKWIPILADEPTTPSSVHYYAGCVAGGCGLLSILSGPFIYLRKEELAVPSILTKFHRSMGILTFSSSSLCFILGLMKPLFKLWLYTPTTLPLLITFCIFYTAVVLFTPLTKYRGTSFQTPK